ncbi:MAG: PDZ domain-containing protein [Simkaniaceae bacterium]|nr:PDZ domain-containing protein [Simkaniaceae bacterium]
MNKKIIVFCLFISLSLSAKPPELTPQLAHKKGEEVLKAHVVHKTFNEEIAGRTLKLFLEHLDPVKTYLLENEVVEFESPTPELLGRVCKDYGKRHFEVFDRVYEVMLKAIDRRQVIEAQMVDEELPQGVDVKEFKDMAWAKTPEELKTRLIRMRALQLEAAAKMGEEGKDMFLKRLEKRRFHRENELVKEQPQAQMLATFLKALTSSLDAHTVYFTPYEASQFLIQVQQRLIGIGAQLRENLNGLILMQLLEGGPALRSGALKVGDRIIAVDNDPIIGLDIAEAIEKIRGPKGTAVDLTVIREGEQSEKTLQVRIIRDEVVLKESRFEVDSTPFGDGSIGILKLFSFYQDPTYSSAEDLRLAIEELKSKGKVNGIILDLRGNAGGVLSQAVAVTSLFISQGIVVSVKDSDGTVHHLRNLSDRIAWDGPLVVLTDKTSASAAEIVGQALQDYGRALLVGDTKTYGKGTYQTFTLDTSQESVNPQGEYKVTRGLYYTVGGKSPQLVGAKSDIVIPGIYSEMEIGESYAKFPLENDSIEPNFKDNLSDVHPFQRGKLLKVYSPNHLQSKLNYLDEWKEILRLNSAQRMSVNKNYQNFLVEIKKEEMDPEKIEIYGKTDLQLEEATHVIKDLILLSRGS